jgi:hypothetical protein
MSQTIARILLVSGKESPPSFAGYVVLKLRFAPESTEGYPMKRCNGVWVAGEPNHTGTQSERVV